MSDIKKAKELLKRYSSARIPFIVIDTMERDRTLEVLKEVADELTISFFVHTMSKGIYDLSSGKVLSEDKSIYSAIDYMSDQMKRRQNLTLILTGIPDISNENADAKQLFDLVTHANETGGSIIVFTNGGVWNQLQRLGMTLKIDNPNEEEMYDIIKKYIDDSGSIQFMDYNDIPSADGSLDDINRPKRTTLKNASDDNLLFTFKTCHNHIYVNEGMQKQPAFFELLKVIFCKIEDERNIPKPLEFYATSEERSNGDGQLTVKNRIEKIFERVKKEKKNV